MQIDLTFFPHRPTQDHPNSLQFAYLNEFDSKSRTVLSPYLELNCCYCNRLISAAPNLSSPEKILIYLRLDKNR